MNPSNTRQRTENPHRSP